MNMSRRDFLKGAAALAALSPAAKLFAGADAGASAAQKTEETASEELPTVFFTKEITPDSAVRMQRILGVPLSGRVAIKVHSGEKGNQNYLRPEFCVRRSRRSGARWSNATPHTKARGIPRKSTAG